MQAKCGRVGSKEVSTIWRSAAALGAVALWLGLLVFAGPAAAGQPFHPRTTDLDLGGFDHACGTAVDSEGDVYVSSAGESKVRVFDALHAEVGSISDASQPCALAVDGQGNVYVSETATGDVVRYKPNAYPLGASVTYGGAEAIDSSAQAKGISVDPSDDFLYVAKPSRIDVYNPAGTLGIDEVQEIFPNGATGGSYKLSFEGQETGAIPYEASHAAVQAALEALSTIGSGGVSVTQGQFGSPQDHLITFAGALAATDVKAIACDDSGLEGPSKFCFIQAHTNGFSGHIGEGDLTSGAGVAAYTYAGGEHYVFAADAGTDQVSVFSGPDLRTLKERGPIHGPTGGGGFGFEASGAYLAVDPGNKSAKGSCIAVNEQACTAGHLLVYDKARGLVDEFDASGQFIDDLGSLALGDAKPTAFAVDRSGGENDGTIYITSGDSTGAELLAYGPLAPPSRALLPEPLSRVLVSAKAVATDDHGDVYVAAGALIHVYDPLGHQIAVGPAGNGIEDAHTPVKDLAVDSQGNLYTAEDEEQVTYYAPSAYPPVDGTTYARHEPPIVTVSDLPVGDKGVLGIAVNPINDHVFVTAASHTLERDSAANGSAMVNGDFAGNLNTGNRRSIAVDGSRGNVYFGGQASPITIVNPAGDEILARINGAGSPNGPFGPNPFVAVNAANGHVLEFQPGEAMREYDSSGGFVAESGGSEDNQPVARVAVDNACALHDPPLTEATVPTCAQFDPSNGNVYVAYDDPTPDSFDLTAYGPLSYGEAPLAATGIATGLGSGSGTLHGTVDPNGFELATCRFEYLTESQYLSNGKTFAGATSQSCVESISAIGRGTSPVPVHVDIAGLDPEGQYRFRLFAENKYGSSSDGGARFGPPAVTAKSALPVLYKEATLRANIDPAGLATSYFFEYGAGAGEYSQSTPTKELPQGAEPEDVEETVTGLAEGATYHFRVVAENSAKVVHGADKVFETRERLTGSACANTEYRTGFSTSLPDCRAYELVTPAETNGLSPLAIPAGNAGAGFNNWLVAPRGAGAGERLSYFTPGTLPGFDGNGLLDGYRAQRGAGDHPTEGWVNQLFGPTYRESVPDFVNPPRQQGVASDQRFSFWKIEPFELLEGVLPTGVYLRSPSGFEAVGRGSLGTDPEADSRYVSPGGSHVIFASRDHLEDQAAPANTETVYDRAVGGATADVVSLKPSGDSFAAGENAAYVASTADSSAILFKVAGVLYLRRPGQTVEVAAGPNTFAGVSEDGRHVFFTGASDGSLPGSLFTCNVDGGSCAGPDATQEPTKISKESIFVNVSDDGSHAFFTSERALTGSEGNEAEEVAEEGKRNLYSWDSQGKETHFVSQLAPQDFTSFDGHIDLNLGAWTTAINPSPQIGRANSPTRSTPDGTVLVFQSHAQLGAYDNEGHGEVYRYDAAAPVGEQLICVSCDSSTAASGADAMLSYTQGGVDVTTRIANVTDDGRKVFFQSRDRLLPEDANNAADVYEWKAGGGAGCQRTGGCLSLISSGQGENDSLLYGMSADGRDVFFLTRQRLIGTDVPGSPSIYDAREGGGIPDPPAEAPCQGDACQGEGSRAPTLVPPASTGANDGNEKAADQGGRRCPKGKKKVRTAAGKSRCVPRHRKQKHHAKRPTHRKGASGRTGR